MAGLASGGRGFGSRVPLSCASASEPQTAASARPEPSNACCHTPPAAPHFPGGSQESVNQRRFAGRSRRFRGRVRPVPSLRLRGEGRRRDGPAPHPGPLRAIGARGLVKKIFRGRQGIVKDRAMRGPFLLRTPSAGLSLGAALFLASCAAPPTAPPPAGRKAAGVTSIDGANVEYAAFQNSAFPYHGLDSELPGDGQDEALPRRRRQRPARPFEPARRPPVGGPDLQRPHRSARRAANLRPGRGRASSSSSSTATTRRWSATSSPASRSCASSPIPASTACWSRRSSRSTRPIRAPEDSGRRAASPPSSNEAEGKLGDFYPQRARRLPAHAGRHRRL